MKSISAALLGLVVALSPLCVRAQTATAPDAEAKYQALLATAKAATGPVDWQALRYAEADRPGFVPDRPNPDRNAMFQAAGAGDWARLHDLAQRVVDDEFTDALAHFLLGVADQNLGHTDEGVRERAIADGLLASIRTGDGKSFDTAFTVIAVREEYDLLVSMHLKPGRQSLAAHNGHQYDVMDVTDSTGANLTYYFQIDREWAAENRAFTRH